ncbi:hypothetical protein Lepto7376_0613 [[Leptolyngbya] sp. PCC 7376]|uniref:hypothetical protein n=1 Tax=[Leptolyngbya] sp. PCC 7376 TaxID=111781 RepID=UPI00029F026B|nr:hypothetical protein [[Leptolyngbya] sp. PCC 7376]AFY37025.1 hypothetical protein Lepto7376_0613 [[Leptolyngbya] sp. PCC 7376]
MSFHNNFPRIMALAITSLLFTPAITLANPLETLEGEVYYITADGHDGFPEGLEMREGALIGDLSAPQPYSLTIYDYHGQKILSFEQILSPPTTDIRTAEHISDGKIQILDSVTLPENHTWLTPPCRIHQQEEAETLAIVELSDPFDSQQIWRANQETKQLELIPVEQVRC